MEYVTEHLGHRLTPKQKEILQKLDQPPYRVLARSANSQGKTFVAAAKCCHFFDTKRPSITLATAPTAKSVKDLLFKEIRKLRPGDPCLSPKAPRLEASAEHYVDGYTSANPDAFQGRHGVSLGLMFDEATGVRREFWQRAETMFEPTGEHWWLAAFNPNDSASPAYLEEETGTWHVVTLSALDHPNVLAALNGDPIPFPGAITLQTVQSRMARGCSEVRDPDPVIDFEFPVGSGIWWHPNEPEFESQVLGRWPVAPTTSLLSPAMVEACFRARRDVNRDWQITVGCDVARFGDDSTTIALRCGPCLLALEVHKGVNTTWIAERIRTVVCQALTALGLDRSVATTVPVHVDDTGGYGAGVIDQAGGWNFIGVNNSRKSPDPQYPNTRTYLWCNLASIASQGVLDLSRLSQAEQTAVKQELTAARYRIDSASRRCIDSKQVIKDRLRRSPDRADAISLAFYLAV